MDELRNKAATVPSVRFLGVILSAALLALLVAACAPRAEAPTVGRGVTPSPAPTPAPSEAAPRPTVGPSVAVVPTPVAPRVAAPVQKEQLNIGISSLNTEQTDPLLTNSARTTIYLQLLFDSLVGTTPDEREYTTNNGIAEAWEVSKDLLTWTFKVREGVLFHDGRPLTAEDVKFSIERMITKESVATFAPQLRAAIKSVEAPDARTLKIHLKAPTLTLLYYLSSVQGNEGEVMPKDYIQKVGSAGFTARPVGSGPYKFVSQLIGNHKTFEAVEKHWAVGKPQYKRVKFRIAPETSTRVALLRVGQADIIDIPREQIAPLRRDGFNIFRKPFSVFSGVVFFQLDQPSPLQNVKVREALGLAIDKEAILQKILYGAGQVYGAIWQVSPVAFGYEEALKVAPPVPYNPKRARELLAEAGYPDGRGLPPLNVYQFISNLAEDRDVSEAVVGYWDAIGVKSNVISSDYTPVRAAWIGHTMKNPAVVASFSPGAKVYVDGILQFHHNSKGPGYLIKDAELDAATSVLAASATPDEYIRNLVRAVKRTRELWLTIPTVAVDDVLVTKPEIGEWPVTRTKAGEGWALRELVREKQSPTGR